MQGSYCKITTAYLIFLLAVLCLWGYTPSNDGDGYIELARECLAAGQPYPCTASIHGKPFIWNIGQINLIALSLGLFRSVLPVLVLMCAMKALTALLIARITERLFGYKAGMIAVCLYMAYPNNWGQSTTLLSEIPAVTLLLAAIHLLLLRNSRGAHAVLAGILLASANWFRSVSLVFLVAIFLYYLFFQRKRLVCRYSLLLSGYAAFVLLVGTGCWLRTGYFIYQGDTLWFNMAEATYETSVAPHYNSEMYPKGTARYIPGREHMTAMECAAIWRERSLAWLKEHKADYLRKIPGRLVYMYMNDMDNLSAFLPDKSRPENNFVTLPYRHIFSEMGQLSAVQWLGIVNLVFYLLLLIGFLLSSVSMIRKRENWGQIFLPVFLTVGGSLAIVLAVHGETRFKAPFMPFIFMMVAAGLQQIIQKKQLCQEP
ncbi:MAG: glycosyltransferase family 39 protein [Prevotella sp.]|nr:glycosyltransferase family 39 protein [Prevotella sp.]